MTLYARIPGLLILGSAILCGQTSSTPNLTAREIFYGESKPSASAAKHPPSTAHTPKPSKSASDATQTATATKPPSSPPPAPSDATPTYQNAAYVPLGLKYSILKRQPDGDYTEVDPDENFVHGDRIRVRVETNDTGYLYVVNMQSSSGNWQVLYPSSDAGGMKGNNKVEKGHEYLIPKTNFRFDENAGTEKLFVILSRQPEEDLEKLIYSLQESKTKKPQSQIGEKMMASNLMVEDDLIKKMRQTYGRDLLIEKVDDSKTSSNKESQSNQTAKNQPPATKKVPGAPKSEKAYYVVNPANSPDSRVVADIPLRHQ
ncbi:MAG: DUF4384 domain-containing protein [Acidobacteriaceae bacterium]|nr:DUF4384 domain-containing protein [Acidobacteriaceae bacterium]